jgi:hypothetical protein
MENKRLGIFCILAGATLTISCILANAVYITAFEGGIAVLSINSLLRQNLFSKDIERSTFLEEIEKGIADLSYLSFLVRALTLTGIILGCFLLQKGRELNREASTIKGRGFYLITAFSIMAFILGIWVLRSEARLLIEMISKIISEWPSVVRYHIP